MTQLNLLVLSHMFPAGDADSSGIFVYEQSRHLADMGCDVRVISPRPWVPPTMARLKSQWRRHAATPSGRVLSPHLAVHYPRYPRPPGRLFLGVDGLLMASRCLPLIVRLRKRWRFDVIHAHSLLPDGLAALMIAKYCHVPLICTAHGSDVNTYPFYDRLCLALSRTVLANADVLITVSRALGTAASQLHLRTHATHTIHNGVDLSQFHPMDRDCARRVLGLTEAPTLLFAGNLVEVKGAHLLPQVLEKVAAAVPAVRMLVVGDGPLQNKMQQETVARGIADRILFVGRQPHGLMPCWIAASDLVVMPSLSEGYPTLIPEALACGRPVVATAVGGVSEVLNEDVGALTPPNDVAAFAAGATRALDKSWTPGSLRAAVEHLSWRANAAAHMDIYQKLLSAIGDHCAGSEIR